jgi:hypothetical protein
MLTRLAVFTDAAVGIADARSQCRGRRKTESPASIGDRRAYSLYQVDVVDRWVEHDVDIGTARLELRGQCDSTNRGVHCVASSVRSPS